MKKTIKYSLVSLIILLCMVIFYLFHPMGGYLGGETLWGYLKSNAIYTYINLSPDRLLHQRMTILNGFVARDFLLKNDYKMVFSGSEDLYEFSDRNKYAPIFKGFFPLVIKDKCFIFKADINVINESVGGKISKYKKESPTSTSECKSNCSVYFTEKGLLTKDDVYSCQ